MNASGRILIALAACGFVSSLPASELQAQARMYAEPSGLIISEISYGFGADEGGIVDEVLFWTSYGLKIAKFQIPRAAPEQGTKNLITIEEDGDAVRVAEVVLVRLGDGTVEENPPYAAAAIIESLGKDEIGAMALAMLERSDSFAATGTFREVAAGQSCEIWSSSDGVVELCVWQGLPLASSSSRADGQFWQEKEAVEIRLGPVDPGVFERLGALPADLLDPG